MKGKGKKGEKPIISDGEHEHGVVVVMTHIMSPRV
jgi:hypothetical protein